MPPPLGLPAAFALPAILSSSAFFVAAFSGSNFKPDDTKGCLSDQNQMLSSEGSLGDHEACLMFHVFKPARLG